MAGIPELDVMRSKSVTDLAKIELRFDPGTDLLRARQLVAERVQLVTPSLPTLGLAAVHDPAAVLDQPHHEDRDVFGNDVGHRHVDDRLLEHPGPAARVPGVANVAIWGERLKMYQVQTDPSSAQRRPGLAEPGHAGDRGRVGLRPDAVLRWGIHRHRRVRGDAEPTPERGECAAHRHPGGSRPSQRRRTERPDAAARGCRRRRQGSPAPDWRRSHQRWSWADAHRREVSLGQHR